MRLPLLLAIAALAVQARGEIDFAREVRPIFSDHCFACHGPDAAKRKAGLRLDERESAFGKAESGEVAIVPGDPDRSELVRRITTTDKDDVMPPPKEHKQLTPEQVALLTRWVRDGAKWTGHWAFVAPVKPKERGIADSGLRIADWEKRDAARGAELRRQQGALERWAQNPIDGFVLDRLLAEGLTPSRVAEPEKLIRRMTLDLTGLPPTPAEVDAFVAETIRNPQSAIRNAADRLLASPHFGERLALPWLDLARYGDTSGYHNDSLRDMWLWREWVIGAFNANKPFSDFSIEQLAGDLLPGATVDQKIASGFHRNVMTSDEGGLIDEEYLNLYVVDRVATTGATWFGLTLACAQCHDHKYDPVTQRDFYQLYAFFHNVPESGKDGVRDRNPKPFLAVPSAEQAQRLAQLNAELDDADLAERELAKGLDARQAEWEKTFAQSAAEPAGPWTRFPLDADGAGVSDTGAKIAAAAQGAGAFVEGAVGGSYRTERTGWLEYGDCFGFERGEAFTVAAWLRLKPEGGSPFGRMQSGGDTRGWDVEFHGTRPSFHLIHQWPGNAIHVQGERDLPPNEFLHLTVSYDGSGKAAGVRMFVNGVLEKTAVKIDTLTGTAVVAEPFSIGRRGKAGAPFTGRVDDLRIYPRALPAADVAALGGAAQLKLLAIPAEKRSKEQKEQLQKFYRANFATEFAAAKRLADERRKVKDDFAATIPNTMVMAEMEKPRDTFMKVRGAYDRNGEKVAAGTPHFLPPLAAQPADGKRHTRLDLARWIVSPENPLTARVTVNRWWAMLFGTGIVKSVNDFGAQGEWPSHPELLDWLAVDFARDWDIKRAVRQMVTSAAYCQSAAASPALLARDSENRLLARGPRHRLDAEFIRDNALAIAGLLNPAIGGKSTRPAQPPGIWEVNDLGGGKFVKSTGAEQYRRGLYTYWRRSTVYPSFITFDAPTREFCVATRARTSTPLQSLVLMNDPVYVEAARAFAQRILAEGGPDNAARLAYAWRLALGRVPSGQERAILAKTLDRQLATYAQDPAAAKALLAIGDAPKPAGVSDPELAAWTALCNVILNLNETITN